jgi:thiamine-monophosphate kinase
MIDCSDGLAADLGHILEASEVGADLVLADLPLSLDVAMAVAAAGDWALPLASGDDYELCFTLPVQSLGSLPELAGTAGCPLAVIGRIREGRGLRCWLPDGGEFHPGRTGYDHFAA